MTRPQLSIIVPTIGRPTLERLLASIRTQAPAETVEILVVADTHGDGLAAGLVQLTQRLRGYDVRMLPCDGGYHAWGHPQRTYGQAQARGRWIMFSQDDDAMCVGAFAAILPVLERADRPVLFRVDTWQAGVVWRSPDLWFGNIDADCIAVPNDPARLVAWGAGYAADYDYIAATCAAWGDAPIWHDAVIARGRPDAMRAFQSPPVAGD